MATGGHSFFGAESSNFGGAAPRTPLRSGFGSNSTFGFGQSSQQQQQQPSSDNSQFSFGGNPQQPVQFSSSPYSTADQSGGMYQQQNIPRQSSFRNLRRSTSNGGGTGGGLNAAYGVHESTTPKTVRWQDAPQFQQSQSQQPRYQTVQQPQQNSMQMQQPSQGGYSNFSTSSFAQSYSSSSPFQQPQQQRTNEQITSFGQSRTSDQFHNASSNLNASQNTGSYALVSQSSNTQQPNSNSAVQTKSAFNTSLASLSRPLSISTSPARATITKPTSSAIQVQTTQPSKSGIEKAATDAVITPRSAIVNRIKWNLAALFVNWVITRIQPLTMTYWYALSLTLTIFGGDSDVRLASILSWMRNAFFIVLLANLLEAFIRLQTYQESTPSAATLTANKTTTRKPSLANPPNRQVSSSSSPSINSNRISLSSSGFKSNIPRQYAQDSPLRESINRASASAKIDNSFNGDSSFSSSFGGEGWRGPSHLPANLRQSSIRNRSSSPAAAYLARKQERRISGNTSGLGEFSFTADFDDGTADFSQDSIDVNRAIRALSASYQREFSQGPMHGSEHSREGVAV